MLIHTDNPDKYFIGLFKKLSEYRESNMQIWIDDGDRRVRGRLRPYVKHCDTVLRRYGLNHP